MIQSWARKLSAVFVAAIVGVTLTVGASPAHAADQKLDVFSGPIGERNQMIAVLTLAPAGTPLDVYIDKKKKATVKLRTMEMGGDTLEFINYDKSWGLGVLQVRNGTEASKPIRLRAAVKIENNWEFRRIGKQSKKLRITVTAKKYNPAKNVWVKSANPILQAKDGKWKTVTTIKLNNKGKGKVVLTPKKAFKYRFVVKQTKNYAKATAFSFGKI